MTLYQLQVHLEWITSSNVDKRDWGSPGMFPACIVPRGQAKEMTGGQTDSLDIKDEVVLPNKFLYFSSMPVIFKAQIKQASWQILQHSNCHEMMGPPIIQFVSIGDPTARNEISHHTLDPWSHIKDHLIGRQQVLGNMQLL